MDKSPRRAARAGASRTRLIRGSETDLRQHRPVGATTDPARSGPATAVDAPRREVAVAVLHQRARLRDPSPRPGAQIAVRVPLGRDTPSAVKIRCDLAHRLPGKSAVKRHEQLAIHTFRACLRQGPGSRTALHRSFSRTMVTGRESPYSRRTTRAAPRGMDRAPPPSPGQPRRRAPSSEPGGHRLAANPRSMRPAAPSNSSIGRAPCRHGRNHGPRPARPRGCPRRLRQRCPQPLRHGRGRQYVWRRRR